jgi:hypothetical protein
VAQEAVAAAARARAAKEVDFGKMTRAATSINEATGEGLAEKRDAFGRLVVEARKCLNKMNASEPLGADDAIQQHENALQAMKKWLDYSWDTTLGLVFSYGCPIPKECLTHRYDLVWLDAELKRLTLYRSFDGNDGVFWGPMAEKAALAKEFGLA